MGNTCRHASLVLPNERFQSLLDSVREAGYELVGPTVRDRAIVYEPIDGVEDLPSGWIDVQEGGAYRLERSREPSLFGFTVGPHSWKKFLHPPRVQLWKATRSDRGLELVVGEDSPPQYAFLGVRPCEVAAIAIQDRVFTGGEHVDPTYAKRRSGALVIAVQCSRAAATCFCASMGTGPRADDGFDLALTERIDGDAHDFVVEIGSDRGAEVVAALGLQAAGESDTTAALKISENTASQMQREMNPMIARDVLSRNIEHPRWKQTAERCLACGNCTMVCPTCFCTTVEDSTNLAGNEAERVRHWDSCFSTDFSYIHGGSVRRSTKSRYRQWITHKLSSWHGQFDGSGCVGCGRCITWCPVGIDITEETEAIRASELVSAQAGTGG